MGLFHYLWSRTAASNSSADAQINWAEGQAPSSVNDSARAMMASLAGYRDDIAGAIATGGTSTAYTVTSYQIFDTLAHMSGQLIAFTPHTTNGATVTLNVDGLGAKPLRSAPSVELTAGVLVQGTPYVALYNNSDAVWYLQNFYVNPYVVPVGGMIDWWGSSVPNSSFAFPIGQAISRSTYSALFTLMSTTHGVGDGSTTFNVPDVTGRVTAMKEASATRLTTAGGGVDGATIGATGGSQNLTLAANQIPTLSGIASTSDSAFLLAGTVLSTSLPMGNGGSTQNVGTINPNVLTAGARTSTGAYTNASQAATKTVMPTIICNKIMRII